MAGGLGRAVAIALGMLGLLVSAQVTSVAAATCALSAPPTVAIGAPLAIIGSGFPANTSVAVSLTIEGGPSDEFTAQSDATGAFEINLTPEARDTGITTVVATTGGECTAQAVIAVGVAPVDATPPPVEEEADPGAAAPRTDAIVDGRPTPATPSALWFLAGLSVMIGIAGLIATRPSRAR